VTTAAAVQTDPAGQFSFNDIGDGNWQIQPQKTGDIGGAITALDAVYALQAAASIRILTPEQQMACDVTGDGEVTAFDAVRILQYHVGLISQLPAAQLCNADWLFIPRPDPVSNQQVTQPALGPNACASGAIAFAPLVSQANNQNFSGVLLGDCSGQWQPASSAAEELSTGTIAAAEVQLKPYHRHGRSVRLALSVTNVSTLLALDAQVQYDPAQLIFRRITPVGSARQALAVANPDASGLTKIALASAEPMQPGRLLVLDFLAKPGQRDAPTVSLVSATASGE